MHSHPTHADNLADAKRNFRWQHQLPPLLAVAAAFVALSRLVAPDVTGSARIAWALVPFPFFAWEWWASVQRERLADELVRQVQMESSALAFRLYPILVTAVTIVAVACWWPIRITTNAGTVSPLAAWATVVAMPMLLQLVSFLAIHRRYVPK